MPHLAFTMRPILSNVGIFLPLLLLTTCVGRTAFQPPAVRGQPQKDELAALIDKLQDVAEGDVGYMPTMSGSSFLPLGTSQAGAMLLGQGPPASSDTLRELVKRGAVAIPQLV